MNAVAADIFKPARVWSQFQNNIFAFCTNGEGNAIVEAVAGSGKTTTIVEAMNRIGGSAIFLAFNKAIAEELKARGVNAKTFHSLCYGPVMRSRGAFTIDASKVRNLMYDNFADDDVRDYSQFMLKLVGLAKQAGIGCLIHDVPQNWLDIVEHHDMDIDAETNTDASIDQGIECARQLLKLSNESKAVDFDDLLYFAVKDGLSLSRFDWIFVDEAQDTNAIRRAILRKLMGPSTRLIAVGDPSQAIYGFNGADSDSLHRIGKDFNAATLPLSVSYRCPRKVVELAQRYAPHIQPCDTAPEGTVRSLGEGWDLSIFEANDLVVCRTTAPLLGLAYRLLRAHKPVRVMGREIGTGLKSLIKKQNADDIEGLIASLDAHNVREMQKAIAKGNDAKAQAVQDKTDCVMHLISGLLETDRTISALLAVIDTLFADVRNATTLATIHKAKGLEARKVVWLNSSQCPSKWAKSAWQQGQERNLMYVAVTRSMDTLVMIEDPKVQR